MRKSTRAKKIVIRFGKSNAQPPAPPQPSPPPPPPPSPPAVPVIGIPVGLPVAQAAPLPSGTISKFSDIKDNVDDYELYKEIFTIINNDIQKRYNIIIDKYKEK